MRRDSTRTDTIAEALGVSKSTVSRALNDRYGVSEETRRRVLALAEELDYRPNRLAQALRQGRSRVIGAVVGSALESLEFDAPLLYGIELAARDAGYLLMLGFKHRQAEVEPELIKNMLAHGVAGLVIYPSQPPGDPDRYSGLHRQAAPVVWALVEGPVPGDLVQTDNCHGGHEVARHLIQQGCQDLVFLRGDYSCTDAWCRDRLAGATQALQEAGLPPPTVLTTPTADRVGPEGARRVLEAHLAAGGRMDALFGAHDAVALPALPALAQLGLRVPQDVAVAGFDDVPQAAISDPPLTTVRQDRVGIGVQAVNLLLDRIEGRREEPEPIRQYVPAPLIVRDSSERRAGGEAADSSRLAPAKDVLPHTKPTPG